MHVSTKQDFQGALAGSVALANILKKFAEEREQTRLQRKKSASKILNTRQKVNVSAEICLKRERLC